MFKGGLGDLMQQAQKMREDAQRIQESLAKRTVEGTAGGGMVKVIANGKQQIVSVSIDPEVLKMNDRVMLQDLIAAGVNQALKAASDLMAQEMSQLTAGLGPLAAMFNK